MASFTSQLRKPEWFTLRAVKKFTSTGANRKQRTGTASTIIGILFMVYGVSGLLACDWLLGWLGPNVETFLYIILNPAIWFWAISGIEYHTYVVYFSLISVGYPVAFILVGLLIVILSRTWSSKK